MNYRVLGRTGLYVSEICYGVMTFTGKEGWTHLGTTGEKEAERLTKTALDHGVNFFDTADFYSEGTSEEMLGKALGSRRKEAVITTKFGFRMSDGPNGEGASRKRIMEACEASLKRLGTDYIDLYLIHTYDFITPLEETLSTLDMLVKQGKIRYAGCSNFTSWQLMKAAYLCRINNREPLINLQTYYSLVGRDIEFDIVPACLDQEIGITVWGPLHGGILTGKYRKKEWPEGTRIKKPGEHLPYDEERGVKILDVVFRLAEKYSVTPAQISLNYLLRKKGVSAVITGAKNEKQLKENIKTSDFELSESDVKALDEVSRPEKPYPHWYFDIFRDERRSAAEKINRY